MKSLKNKAGVDNEIAEKKSDANQIRVEEHLHCLSVTSGPRANLYVAKLRKKNS